MHVVVALLLAAAVAANAVRISVSPTSLTIEEGFKQVLTFKLDEPIICPDLEAGKVCSVVVKLTNSHPNQVALDNCHVKWTAEQWHTERYVTVSAVEDFVDDKEQQFTIKTEVAESLSSYYNGYDAADVTLKTLPRPSAVCSATGDPHYRTFDGFYYHIYAPGRVVFYKSTNPHHDFEMQTDMYSFYGRPSVHCAIAVRENNDVVVASLCHDGATVRYRRTCGSSSCRANSFPKVSITSGSNPSYIIDFASGTRVTAQVHYWTTIRRRYMNVYATAPGADYGQTVGVCGNNDGNRNNDLSVGYNGVYRSLADLYESQRPTVDLFSWMPSTSEPAEATLPPFAEECAYKEPTFVRPLLNHPDAEDITNLLKQALPTGDDADAEGINFEDDENDVLPERMDEEDALVICQTLADTEVAKACLTLFPNFDMRGYIEGCAEDLAVTGGDPDFLGVALEGLEAECADEGNRDLDTWETDNDGKPVEPNHDLQNVMCPNACSGHGTCVATRCACDGAWAGVDCSINKDAKPVVTSLTRPFCDGRHLQPCPEAVSVVGSNFFLSSKLACRFGGTTVTAARYLGSIEVSCAVPARQHKGTQAESLSVEVTTDGETWSEVTAATQFTWYDSVCQICSVADGCVANPESCTIESECYLSTQTHPDNICRRCEPAQSASDWSFVKGNTHECGPIFSLTSYTARIISSAAAGDVVITVDARNPLVAGDPDSAVTYSLRHNTGEDITSADYFDIDATTGVVSVKADLEITAELLMKWHPLLHVVAVDKAGRENDAPLYIEAWETNEGPVFEQPSYAFTLAENTAPGTVLGSARASDGGTGEFGDVTYVWLQQVDNHKDAFVVDAATGAISVGATAPDFEALSTYDLQLMAKDGGGQYRTVAVTITVTDVNEAPSGVTLTPAAVDENLAAGAVVGQLAAQDPDADDTFTFALVGGATDAFVIVDSELQTARVLDAEEASSLSVVLRVTDAAGLATQTTLTVTINNVNEPPHSIALERTAFAENSRGVLSPLTVEDDDEGDFVACTLTETDGGRFEVVGGSPQQLVLVNPLDFETATAHEIEVTCEDAAGAMASERFTLTIVDAAEAPEAIALDQPAAVSEAAGAGAFVGTVSAIDKDANAGAITFAVDGAGSSAFAVGAATCAAADGVMRCTAPLTVAAAGQLDYDTSPTAAVTLRATDSTGLAAFANLEVALANVNEPPRGLGFLDGSCSVEENAPAGTLVCQLIVDDPDADDTFTFELLADTTAFELVVGENGARRRRADGSVARVAKLLVKDGSAIDYEANNGQIALVVAVTDAAGLRSELSATVTVTDEPRTVVFAADSTHYAIVPEDVAVGTSIGALTVRGLDTPGAVAQLALLEGQSSLPFTLETDSQGVASLQVAAALDAEVRAAYLVVVAVSFVDDVLPAFQTKLTVSVTNVDEAPEFVNAPTELRVSHDTGRGTTLVRLAAVDPEGAAVTLTLTSDKTGVLELTADGALRLTAMPSQAGVKVGKYKVTVTAASASAGDVDGVLKMTIVIVDDCDGNPCNNKGKCTDIGINAFSCDCKKGSSGETCEQTDISLASEQDKGATAGSTAGIIVGALCLIALLAVLVVVVVRRRRDARDQKDILAWSHAEQGVFDNPTFMSPGSEGDEPMYASTTNSSFTLGVANPMYAWYRPDMTRGEATEELLECGEGAFVVRDSKATPGWHMLVVKTPEGVLHEKIRPSEHGMYELMPTSNRQQPAFEDLPSLVNYYGSPRTAVGYVLDVSSFNNPMYAMGATSDAGHYHTNWHRDAEAPQVPLKEREVAAVETVAIHENDDIYTNTAEAHAALNRSTIRA